MHFSINYVTRKISPSFVYLIYLFVINKNVGQKINNNNNNNE